MPRAALPLAALLLLVTGPARAEIDPLRVLYLADYVDPAGTGSPLHTPHGLIAAIALEPPHEVLRVSAIQNLDGALALDPIRNVLYGGHCCISNDTLEGLDATTLEPVPERSLPLPNSGSVAMTIDPLRRVLWVYDTVKARLFAVDLASERYGRLLDAIDLPQLAKEPLATSGGNMIVFDDAERRLFLTGGVGGPILAIDASTFEGGAGTFGAVTETGQRCRTFIQSSGALALDPVGRRLVTIPATGRVRFFSADPPYATIGEVLVPDMGESDCGLYWDPRNDTLYVGREFGAGRAQQPLAIDLSGGFPGVVYELRGTTTTGGANDILHAMAFTGPTGPFAVRAGDGRDAGPSAPPLQVEVVRQSCSDAGAPLPERGAPSGWVLAALLAAGIDRRRRRV